jgi:class 3 adenylate cyclase
MAEPMRRTLVWRFDTPPETVWPILADTARFNEAAGLPNHAIEETPRPDGSVEYVARARKWPFNLVWEEKPVNWVWGRWFEHCRTFRTGPIASLCARLELFPDGAGSRVDYTIEATPADVLGRLILRTGFFAAAGRTFGALAAAARDHAKGLRETPFDYRSPAMSPAKQARLAQAVARIEETPYGHGLAGRIADRIRRAQEVDLIHMRPLALAREWGVAERDAVDVCLRATRDGLLDLRWDLLCPRCRIAKASVDSLDALPTGAHCDTCNIDYGRDFARNVELSFRPAPAFREIATGEYCLFGPMSTPHIKVHVTVPPGGRRSVEAELAPGPYRLRTLEPGPAADIDHGGGAFPEIVVAADRVAAGPPCEAGRIVLRNEDSRPRTFVVEDRAWARDAFTADRVATLQAFRDLFSDQVLRPGDEVAIARVALLFTDLSGSTAMYEAVGDAAAYHLVRDHFAFLGGIVRDHDGALVKTIGDAVMAAFREPADALDAALVIQRRVAEFNARSKGAPIAIKVGLHEGPCIAVTLNGRLDYFGTTVNMAARLQGESRGGDIVLSAAMAEDVSVAGRLASFEARRESAPLKGFDAPVPFLRLAV